MDKLVIRREQLRVLSQITRAAFEERMVAHLTKHFAAEVAQLEEPELRAAIRHGVDRAEARGYRADRDVARFLNLMFTFGRDFDTDASLRWAAATLASDPPPTMNQLYAAGIENLDSARGLGAASE